MLVCDNPSHNRSGIRSDAGPQLPLFPAHGATLHSPSLLTMTPALSSKWMNTPSFLLKLLH